MIPAAVAATSGSTTPEFSRIRIQHKRYCRTEPLVFLFHTARFGRRKCGWYHGASRMSSIQQITATAAGVESFLLDVADVVNSTLDLDTILKRVAELIKRVINY